MKVSFALGCQRWCCHGNSFYCYQSSTVWQVNHLFIWVMILSRLDVYSCGMIAEELKIMSVSEMIGWPRFKGTLLSIDFHSQNRHNALNLPLHSPLIVTWWRDIWCCFPVFILFWHLLEHLSNTKHRAGTILFIMQRNVFVNNVYYRVNVNNKNTDQWLLL